MSDTINRLRELSSANLGRTASDDEAIDGVCESAIEELEQLRALLIECLGVLPSDAVSLDRRMREAIYND